MALTKVSGDVIQSTSAVTVNTLNVGTGVTISGGIVTATTFLGNLTGNVTGNATGLSGTPNITVGSIIASSATISGNISVAGTVTYEDVTNVDSIGVVTARSGIVIGTGASISSPGSNILTLGVNNTERLRINTTGVGIGTTVAEATGSTDNQGGALFLGNNLVIKSSSECGPYLFRDNDNAPDIRLYSTKGTHDSRIAKTNNSLLGQIHWHGYDGSAYSMGAEIFAITDGNVGVSSMPSRLEFKTSSSGSATPTTRMTIDSSGRVTKPYQPAFMVRGDESGSKAADSKFAFTSTPSAGADNAKVCFDRGGDWSNANDRFTAPVAGAYHFYFGLYRQSATSTFFSVAPRLNGNQLVISDSFIFFTSPTGESGNTDDGMYGSFTLNLAAGDYVELFMRTGASTITIYNGHSFFGGHLIG